MEPGSARGGNSATASLMEGALAELLAVGQADFTMEGVARRGFYAIGTVYERWPDKPALLATLAEGPIRDALGSLLSRPASDVELIEALMFSPDGHQVLSLVGEILLAGQTMEPVRTAGIGLWHQLREGAGAWLGPGMTWYVATNALGNALLGLLGIRGPGIDSGWSGVLVDAARVESAGVAGAGTGVVVDPDVPGVPLPSRDDPVAQALIEAARSLLAEHGAAGTTTRDIAATAGVTTGALYRRYDGKSTLLSDVLLTQLEPQRYAWTWDLIEALAQADPYSAAATVLADRIVLVSNDLAAQRVLIQVGIAARNDVPLRAQVAQRIEVAMQARRHLMAQLAESGLVRGDVDPAAYAWAFQTLPVGNRALLPLGIAVVEDEARSAMRAIMAASAQK